MKKVKVKIFLVILFLLFLMFPLGMKDNQNNIESINTGFPVSSGGFGELWQKSIVGGRSISIEGEFIYSLSYDDNIVMAKRLGDDGDLVWEKTISDDDVRSLSKDSIWQNNESIYTAWTYYNGWWLDPHDTLLSKWNNSGDLIWNSTLEYVRSPSIWSDNESIYVLGEKMDWSWRNLYLSRVYLSNGSIAWEKLISLHSFQVGGIWGNNENVYVFGDNAGERENLLIKFSKNGSVIWTKKPDYNQLYNEAGAIWGNENFLFTTSFFRYPREEQNFVVSKWDFDGNIIWNSTATRDRYMTSIYADDNNVWSFGGSGTRDYRTYDFYSLIYWDIETGNITSEKKYGEGSYHANICVRGENKNLYTIVTFPASSITKWVYDENPPTLTDLENISYNQSDSPITLRWYASDENPSSYTIFKSGDGVESGNWVSGEAIEIQINISSLLGQYRYGITVWDISGNTAYDDLIVTIEDTTEDDSNGDSFTIPGFNLPALIIISTAGLIFQIVNISKFKKKIKIQ